MDLKNLTTIEDVQQFLIVQDRVIKVLLHALDATGAIPRDLFAEALRGNDLRSNTANEMLAQFCNELMVDDGSPRLDVIEGGKPATDTEET